MLLKPLQNHNDFIKMGRFCEPKKQNIFKCEYKSLVFTLSEGISLMGNSC